MSRVLVVDDDAGVREVLTEMLGGLGHEVGLAKDGKEALACQLHQPADLLLTDLIMPGMEGLETIQQIRKRYPKMKIVAMTGRVPAEGQQDFLEVAQKLGARQTLRKPFTLTQLKETLRVAGLVDAGPH
jgi:CheY-like chemotaxis protein